VNIEHVVTFMYGHVRLHWLVNYTIIL